MSNGSDGDAGDTGPLPLVKNKMNTDLSKIEVEDLIDFAPPECFDEGFDLPWQMTRAERFTLLHLLKSFRPEIALEIGTYQGGSLQALARYSKSVVSIDIDADVPKRLAGRFPNVTYRTGLSTHLLPGIVKDLSQANVGFVLIDGDHTEEGVRGDINAVLKLVPQRPIAVLLHDSFKPSCRQGMQGADWNGCPFVHYVELDFVSGALVPVQGSAAASMVGGFAFALLKPEPRTGELIVYESQIHKFGIVKAYVDNKCRTAQLNSGPLFRIARRFKSTWT